MFSANRSFSGYPKRAVRDGMPGQAAGNGCVSGGENRSRAKNERGSAFIEFTLVMPVLLLVATGLASFGIALHNDLVLTNAVTAGAQLASISRGQTTDPCATAYTAISNAAPSLTSGLSVRYIINGTTYNSNSCTAGAVNMVQGATFQITGSYPYSLAVFGQSFNGSHSLVAQVSEYVQ